MWPFRRNILNPPAEDLRERYRKAPINLFFEALILDVLGQLPPERDAQIEAMSIHLQLNTRATTWRNAVRESLHLSETIDIAILDIWHTNQAALPKSSEGYSPEDYARDFADKYFEEGSKIDVWPGDALQQAKWRIAKYQGGV